jgi:tetratricopeptide (TPR) repeat protein
MKVVFYFVLICLLATSNPSSGNPSLHFSDSLRNAINKQTAHHELVEMLDHIRKHKNELGENYIPLLKQYAHSARSRAYVSGEMKSYDFIGLEYRYKEIFDTAYFYHTKSLELALQEKDSTQLFYNYNNLGQVFRKQDNTDLAIEYFHKALTISDAVGNLRSSSYTMNALGTTLILQKDYDRAMQYFQRSSNIAKQRNDSRTLAYNYGSMGEIFLAKEQVDSAMYYFQISREMLVETGSDSGMGVAEHLIGKAYLAKKDFANAKEQFKLALTYHQKDNDLRYQSYCNCYLGEIAIAEKNFTVAARYLDLAKMQALKVNSLKNLMNVYTNFAEMYGALNQWEIAFGALQQSHIYADSILNEKSKKTIEALEIGFETKKKEQQIELLSAENKLKNQRLRAGIILLGVLVVSIIMILYILQIRKRQAILVQNDLRQQVLRTQMNPHFIFNVLGSIQNFMMLNDTRKASNFLSQFASLIRATLNNSAAETISLADEIKMLRNYIELEKMRKTDNFNFEIIYDENMEIDFIQIPPMLIQPFIENAIKHGFKNMEHKGFLRLQITDKTSWVEFIIEDNGIGISKMEKRKTGHKSMAMNIFENRRKLIQQKYKKDFKFDIRNLNETNPKLSGVKITIGIPVLNHD